MKQIVVAGQGDLDLREQADPKAGSGQAVLKTLVTGISAGTEGMWWDGSASALKSGRKSYPYFPGYELVGEVIETGPEFLGAAVGDRVFAMKPHASHAVIGPGDIWFRLPQRLSADAAVAVALTGTGLHAVHRSGITVGDRCAVVGLGVLGLVLVQILAKAMSCRVTAVTGSQQKRDLALRLGAAEAFAPVDAVARAGGAVHASFDCSGVNSGVATAVQLTADQGAVIAAGFYTDPIELDGEAMFARELTVRGVRATGAVGTDNPYNRWDRTGTMKLASDLVFRGIVDNEALVTHRLSPHDVSDGYDIICSRSEPYLQMLIDWR